MRSNRQFARLSQVGHAGQDEPYSHPHVTSTDPHRMAAMTAQEEPDDDDDAETPPELDGLSGADLEALVARIPLVEQDLLYLRYTMRKRQNDIAVMMGFSQANVSYRIARAQERIRVLRSYPTFTCDELGPEGKGVQTLMLSMHSVFWRPVHAQMTMWIIEHMRQTGNPHATQGRARHTALRVKRRLGMMGVRTDLQQRIWEALGMLFGCRAWNTLTAVYHGPDHGAHVRATRLAHLAGMPPKVKAPKIKREPRPVRVKPAKAAKPPKVKPPPIIRDAAYRKMHRKPRTPKQKRARNLRERLRRRLGLAKTKPRKFKGRTPKQMLEHNAWMRRDRARRKAAQLPGHPR